MRERDERCGSLTDGDDGDAGVVRGRRSVLPLSQVDGHDLLQVFNVWRHVILLTTIIIIIIIINIVINVISINDDCVLTNSTTKN